jgi:hypothetical protein
MSPTTPHPPWHKRTPTRIGFKLSGAWLLLFGAFAICKWGEIWTMAPNEFGDFLAGWFAPLAAIWIIIAYILQSNELSLQVQELQHQVKATETVAKAAVDDILSNRTQNGPFFGYRTIESINAVLMLVFVNDGRSPAVQLVIGDIVSDSGLALERSAPRDIAPGAELRLQLIKHAIGKFSIKYRDVWQQQHTDWWEVQSHWFARCDPPTP